MIKQFQIMGVINITPNSFSNQATLSSSDELLQKIESYDALGCDVFDLGAESTAPFNKAVTESEELERFKKFLKPLIDSKPEVFKGKRISIDTYKAPVFETLYAWFDHIDYKEIIWNDVSGVLDEQAKHTLLNCPRAQYVFSHTHVPKRELTSNHMDYVLEDLAISDLVDVFQRAHETLKEWGVLSRVYLDPCFGFSKSEKQNLELLKELPYLIRFTEESLSTNFRWLIGISKKSFLQNLTSLEGEEIDKSEKQRRSEFLHHSLLVKWMYELPKGGEYLFRVHDPLIVQLSINSFKYL